MTDASRALLEAHEVTVRFGGLTAVDGVSLAFHAGELVGMIGPNGAGKTTLFNALSGVQPLTAGRLLVCGRPLAGRGPHRFAAAGVARTFQTPRVFGELSARDNVDFALQFAGRRHRHGWREGAVAAVPASLRDADAVLALVGLGAQAARPAAALTPSQQRLLEIGMALGTRPRLLLLDEVAAGLTEAEVEAMGRLIRRLRDELDLAVIWIEHAVGVLLRHVERVVVLHQGRVLADGVPREVVRQPAVIEAYLGDEVDAAVLEAGR